MPHKITKIYAWQGFAIMVVFFVSFFIRLYKLGQHDLWYDEIATVGYARYPWGNWNAPFYWIALHYWIKIFGISELSLRFPSLIFSFLTVFLVFLLGGSLFDKKTGILAAVFAGLSPLHIWYAQEARDYAMVLFFGTLSSCLLLKAAGKQNPVRWILFIIVSILGLYTNYFYIFLLIAHVIYFFIFHKKMKFNFSEAAYFMIVVLAFVPFLPKFLSKFNVVWHGFWIPRPNWHSFIITLENFMLGYNGSPALYFLADILMIAAFLYIILSMPKNDMKKSFIFCATLFFIPIAVAFFFSKIFFSVYLDRGLMIFSPYFYLVLALGINFFKKTKKVVLVCILISLFFIADRRYFNDVMYAPLEHHIGTYIKKPVKPIVKFLEDNTEKTDIIAFTNESLMPSMEFYSSGRLSPFYYFFDPKFPDSSWQRPMHETEFNIPFHRIGVLKANRIWLVCSDWDRSGGLDENSQSVKDWCDKNLKLEFSKEFNGAWIFRYIKL